MVIGRLIHYAVDAVLISTVLAGVKRSSGFAPDTLLISDPTARSLVDKYLGVGDSVFDMVQATAVGSTYWKREARR
ncbi:DUF1748-domain-containing protein [Dacryopinax primogenitus]|uniref:DUF1748-domain-containing protein n=1 Tax=Dacryopinax primogenitus (strain DJM 731) TaxID=1858805 RepID=M5GG20_DACPD|nr:DUF1748-domain-containing protein [Dacryopinax primogenitus]EJU04723.1 DUF1748-domain-containing protein [Dacryopinax primogenitus]